MLIKLLIVLLIFIILYYILVQRQKKLKGGTPSTIVKRILTNNNCVLEAFLCYNIDYSHFNNCVISKVIPVSDIHSKDIDCIVPIFSQDGKHYLFTIDTYQMSNGSKSRNCVDPCLMPYIRKTGILSNGCDSVNIPYNLWNDETSRQIKFSLYGKEYESHSNFYNDKYKPDETKKVLQIETMAYGFKRSNITDDTSMEICSKAAIIAAQYHELVDHVLDILYTLHRGAYVVCFGPDAPENKVILTPDSLSDKSYAWLKSYILSKEFHGYVTDASGWDISMYTITLIVVAMVPTLGFPNYNIPDTYWEVLNRPVTYNHQSTTFLEFLDYFAGKICKMKNTAFYEMLKLLFDKVNTIGCEVSLINFMIDENSDEAIFISNMDNRIEMSKLPMPLRSDIPDIDELREIDEAAFYEELERREWEMRQIDYEITNLIFSDPCQKTDDGFILFEDSFEDSFGSPIVKHNMKMNPETFVAICEENNKEYEYEHDIVYCPVHGATSYRIHKKNVIGSIVIDACCEGPFTINIPSYPDEFRFNY